MQHLSGFSLSQEAVPVLGLLNGLNNFGDPSVGLDRACNVSSLGMNSAIIQVSMVWGLRGGLQLFHPFSLSVPFTMVFFSLFFLPCLHFLMVLCVTLLHAQVG